MSDVEVSQRAEFSCSYIMGAGNGYLLNSVNYKFEATVCGSTQNSSGILISFEDFKKLLKDILPDGHFVYYTKDIKQQILAKQFQNCGVPTSGFNFEICAERLLEDLSLILKSVIESEYNYVKLKETKLRENASSFVSWKQEVE